MRVSSSRRDDVQFPHALEMPAVVREQDQAMAYRGRANKKVKVVKAVPGSSESAALIGKDPADLIVHRHDFFNIIKETLQALRCFLLVHSVRHSLIELSQRYDAQPNAMRRQLFESPYHRLAALHIVDDPVSVHQVPHRPAIRLCPGPGPACFVERPLQFLAVDDASPGAERPISSASSHCSVTEYPLPRRCRVPGPCIGGTTGREDGSRRRLPLDRDIQQQPIRVCRRVLPATRSVRGQLPVWRSFYQDARTPPQGSQARISPRRWDARRPPSIEPSWGMSSCSSLYSLQVGNKTLLTKTITRRHPLPRGCNYSDLVMSSPPA